MFHRMMPARFEDIVETDDIALDIHIRILDAVPYTRLSSKIDNDVELVLLKEFVHQRLVSDASANEGIMYARILAAQRYNLLQAIFLERDIIVIVEIV